MSIQKIKADLSQLTPVFDGHALNRVETGPLQINEDLPGLFIRGDDAFTLANNLQLILSDVQTTNWISLQVCRNFLQMLESTKI